MLIVILQLAYNDATATEPNPPPKKKNKNKNKIKTKKKTKTETDTINYDHDECDFSFRLWPWGQMLHCARVQNDPFASEFNQDEQQRVWRELQASEAKAKRESESRYVLRIKTWLN